MHTLVDPHTTEVPHTNSGTAGWAPPADVRSAPFRTG